MASKRRLRRKACLGKVRHSSEANALIAKKLSQHYGCFPYKCKYCGSFHLGHPNSRIKNKITRS